ncbi:MAG: helix-turn-helix transcriptional regulator [Chthoniobacteraceae bacterium]
MNPSTSETFKSFFDKSRKSLGYWEERAILDFTEGLLERLEQQGVSKTTLAERLGVSLPYVMKLIGGSNNFTMRTMVKVARALGARLHFELKDDVRAKPERKAKKEAASKLVPSAARR